MGSNPFGGHRVGIHRAIAWPVNERSATMLSAWCLQGTQESWGLLVPGFAKFVVIKKPATKARKGTNPFNGEPMMFKAKPARKIVRARPVKAAKDAV